MKWTQAFILGFLFAVPAFTYAKSADHKPRSDQEVRTIVRKKAPFWLQDGEIQVRINKDSSFGIDGTGGVISKEGKWRVEKGQLKLVWDADKREKSYPVEIVNRLPVIGGASLKDGRYTLK